MNQASQALNKGCIFAEEDGWANNGPRQIAVHQHLFREIASLHVATSLIWLRTKSADFDNTFDTCLSGCPDQIGGPVDVCLFIATAWRLFAISRQKRGMYDRIYALYSRS